MTHWRNRLGSLGAGMLGSATMWWTLQHRRSPVVRAWRRSEHEGRSGRPLACRSFGEGAHTLLLLHGLGATGEFWSGAYDRLGTDHRVLVPDLLGFGRSLDEARQDFRLGDHLDALDELVARQAPETERITVVAHSMGSALALAWAVRHHQRVDRVVCFGAPIYRDRDGAREAISGSGPMARMFVLDTRWARRACALSCAHRGIAGVLAAAAEPALPVAITRRSPLHTWPAYRSALEDLVLDVDWADLARSLAAHAVPVVMCWGTADPFGDVGFARTILDQASQTVLSIPDADHHLPITHAPDALRIITTGGLPVHRSGSDD